VLAKTSAGDTALDLAVPAHLILDTMERYEFDFVPHPFLERGGIRDLLDRYQALTGRILVVRSAGMVRRIASRSALRLLPGSLVRELAKYFNL
jgi:hypothetical protein